MIGRAYCIVTRAASTVIRADRPTPVAEIAVTTSGDSIRSLLPFAGPLQCARAALIANPSRGP